VAEHGQVAGMVLDGPLAIDHAISAEAARINGIGRQRGRARVA
jgi:phosphate acetyltransferase